MLHLALLMIVDVNNNFMLFVACYFPKNGECFFMSAALLARKLVGKQTDTL